MGPVAETTNGRVTGVERHGVLRFGAIPFAAPPIGDLRFAPPAPVAPWQGDRDGTGFGSVAPQKAGSVEALAGAGDPDADEDCLTLNVWTPATDDARRPVMVWIHGGGFTAGSGSVPWYHGTGFAQHGDVVVVTVNYRLGALGWLALAGVPGAETTTANAGLLDQIAALEWARDNIASFGGNPDDVCVFGESAGAMSIATLMGTPAAAGLFSKAIAQSGAAHAVASAEDAAEVTSRLMGELGAHDVADLRAVPAARLLDAQSAVAEALTRERAQRPGAAFGLLPFCPVIDGDVLPRPPIEAVRDGSAAGVRLICGTTQEEWKLFALMLRSVDDEHTLLRRVGRIVEDAHDFVAAYRELADEPGHDDVWTAVMTDRIFRIPAIRLAEAQADHQPEATWMYQLDWASPAFDGRLGSCHALDIPFVFDILGTKGTELLTGPDAPQAIADAMHRAWIAFARTGDPHHEGLPAWPPYDVEARATLHFDTPSTLRHDPAAEARAAWDGLL